MVEVDLLLLMILRLCWFQETLEIVDQSLPNLNLNNLKNDYLLHLNNLNLNLKDKDKVFKDRSEKVDQNKEGS